MRPCCRHVIASALFAGVLFTRPEMHTTQNTLHPVPQGCTILSVDEVPSKTTPSSLHAWQLPFSTRQGCPSKGMPVILQQSHRLCFYSWSIQCTWALFCTLHALQSAFTLCVLGMELIWWGPQCNKLLSAVCQASTTTKHEACWQTPYIPRNVCTAQHILHSIAYLHMGLAQPLP